MWGLLNISKEKVASNFTYRGLDGHCGALRRAYAPFFGMLLHGIARLCGGANPTRAKLGWGARLGWRSGCGATCLRGYLPKTFFAAAPAAASSMTG
jgi:hypothetical protein